MTDTRGGAGVETAERALASALADTDAQVGEFPRNWFYVGWAAAMSEALAADGWVLSRSRSWLSEHRCKVVGGSIGNTRLRCFGTEGHDGDHAF